MPKIGTEKYINANLHSLKEDDMLQSSAHVAAYYWYMYCTWGLSFEKRRYYFDKYIYYKSLSGVGETREQEKQIANEIATVTLKNIENSHQRDS